MMETLCIGVDLGGTNLRLALVNRSGAVLRRKRVATGSASGGKLPFLGRFLPVLERFLEEAGAGGMRVAAVGVAVPGLLSGAGVVLCSVHFPSLQGVALGSRLSSTLGMPVRVMNDANACALGELRFGAARRFRSSLLLTIGTGVGAGVVLDGRLWTGADGAAGEFGHITVEPEGRLCGCGNRGCVGQYASARAIALAACDSSGMRRRSAAAAAAAALEGDAACAAAFEQAGYYLGIAAAGVLDLLNLEAIVLSGGVARSFELLAAPMARTIEVRALAVPAARVRIIEGELGDDAGVVGAASAAFDALEETGI